MKRLQCVERFSNGECEGAEMVERPDGPYVLFADVEALLPTKYLPRCATRAAEIRAWLEANGIEYQEGSPEGVPTWSDLARDLECAGERLTARLEAHRKLLREMLTDLDEGSTDPTWPTKIRELLYTPTGKEFPTWADGMERAAELCIEEAASAKALLSAQTPTNHNSPTGIVRIETIQDCAELLARTIRAFKEAGPGT